MTDDHFRRLERMYLSAPCNEYFSPSIRIGEGRAEVSIEVRPDMLHAARSLHGSSYFKTLDDAAFFAANSLVEDRFVLTTEFHLHFLRPVSTGAIHAEGIVVHKGKRLIVADAILRDDAGRDLARSSATFMESAMPLTPEIGYK